MEFGNRLRQLERQETREEELVRQQLSGQVAEISDDLEQLMAIVPTLDIATARARYSLWLDAPSCGNCAILFWSGNSGMKTVQR